MPAQIRASADQTMWRIWHLTSDSSFHLDIAAAHGRDNLHNIDEVSLLTEHDVYLFKEGTHYKLYNKLGAHRISSPRGDGIVFAVWAPDALAVSVVGDFNGWSHEAHMMRSRPDSSGIWEVFVAGIPDGTCYKFHIVPRNSGTGISKGDPFATRNEEPPRTASVIWGLDYKWNDAAWLEERGARNSLKAPMSVYEVHLGSWRRVPNEGDRFLGYREIAHQLADYVVEMGFTHVELMPVMEHPFYGSWGYQTVGYFAPTSRYGSPQDFMYFVDHMHQRGIGVILDWVPSHFPGDEHGLAKFDGTSLFEHEDPRKGFHPDWSSWIFNYGRHEVRAFLGSSALSWLDRYHIDALRVDAVASMLYLDYSRKDGEWIPNVFGGRENLEAISFLRAFNERVYAEHPDVQTIAEESTAWPMVSRPVYLGGLGFGMKWNMGWMHDFLSYMSEDPLFRRYHHDQLLFSLWYAFTENFMLPLSHDEVVYGKGSLLAQMPGDEWQKFANLRALFGFMWAHPGKKLLFMGNEFAQLGEWNHDRSLDWHLLNGDRHRGTSNWVRDLNMLYRSERALHAGDSAAEGFEWINAQDWEKSIVAFVRRAYSGADPILVVCNFTPELRTDYVIGAPVSGRWDELLNSDAAIYGGTGQGNLGAVETVPSPYHGHPQSLSLVVPPLSVLYLRPSRR